MTEQTHTPGPWYTTTKLTDLQGLICSESTGANIAVSYEAKDAPIIATAPELLEALEKLVWLLSMPIIRKACRAAGYMAQYDTSMYTARLAITKAKDHE